jgi:hypothetical protein
MTSEVAWQGCLPGYADCNPSMPNRQTSNFQPCQLNSFSALQPGPVYPSTPCNYTKENQLTEKVSRSAYTQETPFHITFDILTSIL